jgi:hypothetical protein
MVVLWVIHVYVDTQLWAEDRFNQLKESVAGPVIIGSLITAMVVTMVGWSAAIFWLSYRAILALIS